MLFGLRTWSDPAKCQWRSRRVPQWLQGQAHTVKRRRGGHKGEKGERAMKKRIALLLNLEVYLRGTLL